MKVKGLSATPVVSDPTATVSRPVIRSPGLPRRENAVPDRHSRSGTAFGAVMPRRWAGGPAEPATAGADRSAPRAPGDQRLEGGLQPPPTTLRARLPGASVSLHPHPSMIDGRRSSI